MMCDEQRSFRRWRREIDVECCFCRRSYGIEVELLRKEVCPGKWIQGFTIDARISKDLK